MRALFTLLAVCSSAGLHAHTIYAQTAPAAVVRCAYVDCALRLEPSSGGRRLVRGASGQVIGGFGLFHSSAVDSLLAGPDSTAANTRRYKAERHTGFMYLLAGLTAGVASMVYFKAHHQNEGIDLVGLAAVWAFTIPSAGHYSRAEQHLSRAVWWYNAAVVDSTSKR
jgi:hypothetical protein